MKKVLIAIIAFLMIVAAFTPAAFAEPGKNAEKQDQKKAEQEARKDEQEARKDEVKARVEERKEERELLKDDFRQRMLERKEIKEASKTELKAQRQIVMQYKLQLQALNMMLEDLSEEERALYMDEILALKLQIRDAQRKQLEIASAFRSDIKEILPGVRTGQEPLTEEEVDEAAEVFDDL